MTLEIHTLEQTNLCLSIFPMCRCPWGRPQSLIHFLHLSSLVLGLGNGTKKTPPSSLSGYLVSDLHNPHEQVLTMVYDKKEIKLWKTDISEIKRPSKQSRRI